MQGKVRARASPLDAPRIRAGAGRAAHVVREARGAVETPLASPAQGIGLEVFRKVELRALAWVRRMGKLRHGAAFPRPGPGVALSSPAPAHRYEAKDPSGKGTGEKDMYLGGLNPSSSPGICRGGQPTRSPRSAGAQPAPCPGAACCKPAPAPGRGRWWREEDLR